MLEKGIDGGRYRNRKYGWCERNRNGKRKCEKKKEKSEREIKNWRVIEKGREDLEKKHSG